MNTWSSPAAPTRRELSHFWVGAVIFTPCPITTQSASACFATRCVRRKRGSVCCGCNALNMLVELGCAPLPEIAKCPRKEGRIELPSGLSD